MRSKYRSFLSFMLMFVIVFATMTPPLHGQAAGPTALGMHSSCPHSLSSHFHADHKGNAKSDHDAICHCGLNVCADVVGVAMDAAPLRPMRFGTAKAVSDEPDPASHDGDAIRRPPRLRT